MTNAYKTYALAQQDNQGLGGKIAVILDKTAGHIQEGIQLFEAKDYDALSEKITKVNTVINGLIGAMNHEENEVSDMVRKMTLRYQRVLNHLTRFLVMKDLNSGHAAVELTKSIAQGFRGGEKRLRAENAPEAPTAHPTQPQAAQQPQKPSPYNVTPTPQSAPIEA